MNSIVERLDKALNSVESLKGELVNLYQEIGGQRRTVMANSTNKNGRNRSSRKYQPITSPIIPALIDIMKQNNGEISTGNLFKRALESRVKTRDGNLVKSHTTLISALARHPEIFIHVKSGTWNLQSGFSGVGRN